MSVIAHCHNMGVMHRDLKVWVFGEWGCVLHNECELWSCCALQSGVSIDAST